MRTLRRTTHLQGVQHKPDVAVAAFDERFHGNVVHLQPLLLRDLQHAVANLLLGGSVKLQLEAVVLQRPQLLAPAVIANADDRNFGHLRSGG